MSKTNIEWTQITWNPTTGCNKVSQGCKFCYAEIMSKRLMAMGQDKYKNNFVPTIHTNELLRPYTWKTAQLVFVNSMSDLFHHDFPLEFIQQVFEVMNNTPLQTYQVLTKRADRLAELSQYLTWTDNIWMGVSVENEDVLERVDYLKQTDAQTKFLSLEPLLAPLPNLDVNGIDWVIVGGESGNKARPMREEWVLGIKDKCDKADVPFFFKQWGGKNKKKTGNSLQGKVYKAMPKSLIMINNMIVI